MTATYSLRPTRRNQVLGIALILVLLALAVLVRPIVISAAGFCANGGVKLWENSPSSGGDTTVVCSPTLIPYNVSRSNLGNNPGSLDLHNGCNAGLLQNGTWSDCVSGITAEEVPTGVKIVFYRDAAYQVPILCISATGTHTYDLGGTSDNDKITSMRTSAADC